MFARPIVVLLFGEAIDVERVVYFTRLLAIAVAVFSLGSPLTGIVNATSSVRRSFLAASLPALVFGLTCYFVAGSRWGAVREWPTPNVAAYAMLVVLLAFVVARYCPLPIRFTLDIAARAAVLRGWLRRGPRSPGG